MEMSRMNADFGNSTGNFLGNGYYFEIPTNVVEITKEKAEGYFISDVQEATDLLDRLLISTVIEGEERYFVVGKLSEGSEFSNMHVDEMHNKITSHVPYAMFLASVAYQYRVKAEEQKSEDTVNIARMKMMLPIWLLTRESRFGTALDKMASRFKGEHKVKLLTKGMETELTINVENSACEIEGEVARLSLKYKLVNDEEGNTKMVMREESATFKNFETVLVDIGGGSTDAVLLPKNLASPISRDSYQVIDIKPFLGVLDTLRRDKLINHFGELRKLEKFVVENHKNHRYVLVNPNTGAKIDLTEQITGMLQEYADVLVQRVLKTFAKMTSAPLKFVYFGGEAPILGDYIKEAVARRTSQEIAEKNHLLLSDVISVDEKEVFPPVSRTINLASLELLSVKEG
ncbi:hypothetical protein [Bacillus thuringiensis]|uniref:Alp7A family actin-like protein n=1 Tax=Bacillus thuringiensis TaxID=1428 RepID=UPI000BFE8CA1|nr:hypothetical protein [Bacillus thuringiensis]PGT90087.1 hypothetical protein COD17_10075 [Bacillus thuringiensis]